MKLRELAGLLPDMNVDLYIRFLHDEEGKYVASAPLSTFNPENSEDNMFGSFDVYRIQFDKDEYIIIIDSPMIESNSRNRYRYS